MAFNTFSVSWKLLCNVVLLVVKVSKGAKIRNQYNQVPHLYQWESDKLTVRHHKREPRGQPLPSR